MITRRSAAIPLTLALALGTFACGGETITAVEHGALLASNPKLSASPFNAFACTHCHDTGRGGERIYAGYPLLGAAKRPSFWGGAFPDLKSAVDFCFVYFMKGDRLDPEDPDARSLFEYLVSIQDRGPTEALPLTIDLDTRQAPARGDRARGEQVHLQACAVCHGAPGTGSGKIGDSPILPDEAAAEARRAFPDFEPAAVFTEKVRHGQFFGVGGNMPPFSLEALSDEDLGALLTFYGL